MLPCPKAFRSSFFFFFLGLIVIPLNVDRSVLCLGSVAYRGSMTRQRCFAVVHEHLEDGSGT